ncbi:MULTISPECIES: hypothetical protein [unclassified Actinoplanes]|uniref:hypothetical protein n=1 Tax=unclassified Actinoplanes TaxID=2626549 RepID=UPI0012BA9F30|nr:MULTISPECIES: hypothetical protein [unclassified Actinoplanes]
MDLLGGDDQSGAERALEPCQKRKGLGGQPHRNINLNLPFRLAEMAVSCNAAGIIARMWKITDYAVS